MVLPDGGRVARVATETPTDRGPDAVTAACADTLRRSREAAPPDVAGHLLGIGISSPGPVDPWSGVVHDPPNLGPDFHEIPLAESMEKALGLPAYLDRDTNVAALGENAFGAAKGHDDFLYITVSTGIGGAVVTGGKLLHGPDGTAGELGHVPVDFDGPRCGCGGIGHLEAIAAGVALARDARTIARAGGSPFLEARARVAGPDELTAKDVAEGDAAGDAACRDLMDRARRAFAIACVGFVDIFNPGLIVVGGSIAEHQGDLLLGPARDAVASQAFETPRRRVSIVPPVLGPDVSLAGAHPLVTARIADPGWRRGRSTIPLAAAVTA